MENSIKKMIKEYEEKIEFQDILIKNVVKEIRGLRSGGLDTTDLRHQRQLAEARRQAYVQAKSDIDSLLDNL